MESPMTFWIALVVGVLSCAYAALNGYVAKRRKEAEIDAYGYVVLTALCIAIGLACLAVAAYQLMA